MNEAAPVAPEFTPESQAEVKVSDHTCHLLIDALDEPLMVL